MKAVTYTRVSRETAESVTAHPGKGVSGRLSSGVKVSVGSEDLFEPGMDGWSQVAPQAEAAERWSRGPVRAPPPLGVRLRCCGFGLPMRAAIGTSASSFRPVRSPPVAHDWYRTAGWGWRGFGGSGRVGDG